MRFAKHILLPFTGFLPFSFALGQQLPQRDTQALAVIQQAVTAMGGSSPVDSVGTGTVVIVAGSKTDEGTIRVLTKGSDQSSEQIQTTSNSQTLIYSRGQASEIDGAIVQSLSLELAEASQCPNFPLTLLAGALSNPNEAFQYVGLEVLDGLEVQHVRFWNTFSSTPNLQHLAGFSVRDVWIDLASGLPHKLSYERRIADGSAPRTLLEISFSYYQRLGRWAYPFVIQKSLNGTPWVTISVQSVAFNTGLSDSDFPVQ